LLGLLLCGGCSLLRPDCDPKATAEPSSTSGGACVVQVDDRLLVIRHRPTGRLDLPGGRSKRGESARCTAERETWEEAGLVVRAGPAVRGRPRLFHCEPLETIDAGRDPPLRWWSSAEVSEVLWVDPRTIAERDWRYRRAPFDLSQWPRRE
jgi:8-oxo-dGTP pyrophosphatase MutT (NUDIX family)